MTPDTPDRATAVGAPACADCRVEARVQGTGAQEAGLFLRGAHTTSDRYDLILLPTGRLQLRRLIAGKPTVLAEGPSGLADPAGWTRLALRATGAGPVTLVAEVDGIEKLRATDSTATAIAAAGQAGLWTYTAGVRFDDFAITGP